MFNHHTGFKVAVVAPPGGSPFVVVPPEQVDEVHRLFVENGIGHTVGKLLDEWDENPGQQIIQVGRLWDPERVQDVLDSVQ